MQRECKQGVYVRRSQEATYTRCPLPRPLLPPNVMGAFKHVMGAHISSLPLQRHPPPIATFAAIPLNSPWVSPGLCVAFIFHAECAELPESLRHVLHSDAPAGLTPVGSRACLMRRLRLRRESQPGCQGRAAANLEWGDRKAVRTG